MKSLGAMERNGLFEMALQLHGSWTVLRHKFRGEPRRLEVWLDFARGNKFADPPNSELWFDPDPLHDNLQFMAETDS